MCHQHGIDVKNQLSSIELELRDAIVKIWRTTDPRPWPLPRRRVRPLPVLPPGQLLAGHQQGPDAPRVREPEAAPPKTPTPCRDDAPLNAPPVETPAIPKTATLPPPPAAPPEAPVPHRAPEAAPPARPAHPAAAETKPPETPAPKAPEQPAAHRPSEGTTPPPPPPQQPRPSVGRRPPTACTRRQRAQPRRWPSHRRRMVAAVDGIVLDRHCGPMSSARCRRRR